MTRQLDLSHASDQEVVAWAREGREDASREFMRRFAPEVLSRVYQIVRHRERAEDLTQETFIRAFDALNTHPPTRNPSAWIRRIATNTALGYLRRKQVHSLDSRDAVTPGQIDASAIERSVPTETTTTADRRQDRAALEEAIGQLRSEFRECVLLRHLDERSYEDIAEILDLPLGTVKSRVYRGLTHLKRVLGAARDPSSDPAYTPAGGTG